MMKLVPACITAICVGEGSRHFSAISFSSCIVYIWQRRALQPFKKPMNELVNIEVFIFSCAMALAYAHVHCYTITFC